MSSHNLNQTIVPELNVEMKEEKKKPFNKSQKVKEDVDTSTFSIEERLIAAVWVHERKLLKTSIAQIKINFRKRFRKAPPTKNTLYFWEKKLFSTGKVMDIKRSGRPCKRKAFIGSVQASLQESPGLSIRARAEQLSLPRTTLKKILKEDLNIKNLESYTNAPQKKSSHKITRPENENQAPTQVRVDNTTKQNAEPHPVANNAPCPTDIPQSSVYSFPETISYFPYSALQHYLYPNSNHHQAAAAPAHPKMPQENQNYLPNGGMAPHVMNHPHQTHMPHLNHNGYYNNTQMVCKYEGFHTQ